MSLLEVRNLTKMFGGLAANRDVSMHVDEGEIVGLIGPNGAGKTTLFNCIAGAYVPEEGQVLFQDREIQALPSHLICERGIARTFQIVKTFTDMTVLENVMVGAFVRDKSMIRSRDRAEAILELTGLKDRRHQRAGELTVALRKRLEIARALATDPKLLMLDESLAGLNPRESQQAVEILHRIHKQGYTILMVEHVMEVIMPISNRMVVLDAGRKIAEGAPEDISQDERVIKAYLGERYDAKRR